MQGQPRIEVLLEEVVRKKASDLHIQVGLPPMLRVDGSLVPVNGSEALSEEAVEALVFAVLDEDQKQILLKDKEFDFSFAFFIDLQAASVLMHLPRKARQPGRSHATYS